MTGRPADPGLQPERTALAWQRTALAALACNLVVARLLVPVSVALTIATAALAVALSAALAGLTAGRYRAGRRALRRRGRVPDARPHLAVAFLTVLTAVGALVYVATG